MTENNSVLRYDMDWLIQQYQAKNKLKYFSAHDKKIKKSDKTRHNSNFFDELNHAKSYQT